MKVYIGNYLNWVGPYQIAELLKYIGVPKKHYWKLGKMLSKTPLDTICNKIYKMRNRKIKVKIHDYDTWNFESTLSHIIVPMLKQLKKTKHGIPGCMPAFGDKWEHTEEEQNLAAQQWEEIVDKMIFAFESSTFDWESQFWIQKPELDLDDYPEDDGKSSHPVRWKIEGKCDWKGREEYAARIQEGYELFGKYFQNLWT
jgi:hypothetical protein